jgi:hypothetical protein
MNWKLIFALSGFGLVMAIATVFVIPSNIEPAFWLAIFVACAVIIAKKQRSKAFLHGLFVSLVNSVWITTAHVLFFDTYVASHPGEAAMMANSPIPGRMMMLVTGPIVGVISGLILGLFAFVATKLIKAPAS